MIIMGKISDGAAVKLKTTSGDFFVGIRYYVFNSSFITPFIITILLLITFNSLFVIYIGKDLSHDISSISSALELISHSEDVANSKRLPITSNDEMGELTVAFNHIQDLNKKYIYQLRNNQDTLIEKERLAGLGQMIGGIAHNLKTPIMSISGASKGLIDLINEYDSSIEDPTVNFDDHHEIAKEMREWVEKIKSYNSYMSDVITAVKGQAVALSENSSATFTVEEMLKYVDILMKHELKNALINLKISVNLDSDLELTGNVNSLVQVINNIVSNAIQAYGGKKNEDVLMNISKEDNKLVIAIQDFACGMSKEVQDNLFKKMVTTKGKNGTGLGLFMSYSNIKAHFGGNISFESKEGVGTTFYITIPIR